MRILAASLASLALWAAPANAVTQGHTSHAQAGQDEQIASDLRCTVWTATMLGLMSDDDADSDAIAGVMTGFAYFMGRFEGRSGQLVEEAMTVELIEREAADLDALAEECLPRLAELGERLSNFSEFLINQSPE